MGQLRDRILDDVREYHSEQRAGTVFVPGQTEIWPSGALLDEEDRAALVAAALDLRIAGGRLTRKFESKFAKLSGRRKAHLTNSGSSANLLAVSALTSHMLEEPLRPGDEVITVATGFPTTLNPILQNNLVPVFVDVELRTYNTTVERVAAAIGPRTRAIVLAHTLGNPFPVREMAELAREHGLYLVEDNCDAVGSTYEEQLTGTFGEMSTVSFYPAHHLAMGEGGCLLTSNLRLARITESLRDWGRDCWCMPGQSNRCHKRFQYQLGTLPQGYDHKYIFSQVGYNLKATDLQAALGLSQLRRIDEFCTARRRAWRRLRDGLDGIPHLILPEPTPGSDPSWFGFTITVEPDAPFSRREIVQFLESRRIGTRQLFAGNLTRHPAYADKKYRVVGELTNSDTVTLQTFWVGVYPALTDEMLDYVVTSVTEFVKDRS